MTYLLTNLAIENASLHEGIYFSGDSIHLRDGQIIVASSSHADHDGFDTDLEKIPLGDERLNAFDATFVYARCFPERTVLKIQTDLIAFQDAFYYLAEERFVFSDDSSLILSILKKHRILLELSEKEVRSLLYWSSLPCGKTIIKGLRRCLPAVVCTINYKTGEIRNDPYGIIRPIDRVEDANVAAERLFQILNRRFERYMDSGRKFALGLSGGLDSRVAAFFAKRHHFDMQPFFIGQRTGRLPLLRYDAKRSKEIQEALQLPVVKFIDPRVYPLHKRIEDDLENAPLMVTNAHLNVGYQFLDFEILLNGIMGGELFGALVKEDLPSKSGRELAAHLMTYMRAAPMYYFQESVVTKILKRTGTGSFLKIPENVCNEMMPRPLFEENTNDMSNWIEKLRSDGLGNIEILQRDVWYRWAHNNFRGYFYSLNGYKKVLSAYVSPSVIWESFGWNERLFVRKPVQRELLRMLGALSLIRSQTMEPAVHFETVSLISKFIPIMEKIIRGSSMHYDSWFSKKDTQFLVDEVRQSKVVRHLELKNGVWFQSLLMLLSLVKLSRLAMKYDLRWA